MLPRWRGAAPIQRSIIEMDKVTGISIMKIIPKLDAGPYMMQEQVNIEKEDNFLSLSKKLSILGSKLIIKSLGKLKKEKVNFVTQDEKKAHMLKRLKKKNQK